MGSLNDIYLRHYRNMFRTARCHVKYLPSVMVRICSSAYKNCAGTWSSRDRVHIQSVREYCDFRLTPTKRRKHATRVQINLKVAFLIVQLLHYNVDIRHCCSKSRVQMTGNEWSKTRIGKKVFTRLSGLVVVRILLASSAILSENSLK